jgi:membrane protein
MLVGDMEYGPFSLGGLTTRELGKRVWTRMYEDAAWDTAAQLGYYFMLALFPLVLFLVGLLTVLEAIDVVDPLMLTLGRLMPPQAFALLRGELERIAATPRGDLLTFGALGAVWAASSGVEALLNSLNRAYEVHETRSYVKVRGTAILMTFAIVGMIITAGALLMFGDHMAARVAVAIDQPWATTAVAWFNYALGVLLLILGLEIVYYYGPNVANQKWRWVSPGSLVGVLLFVLASSGFSAYVRYSDPYSFLYGSMGAIVILLFWLYILGLAFLTGGEINAQVACAAREHGRRDAPKVGVESEPPNPDVDVQLKHEALVAALPALRELAGGGDPEIGAAAARIVAAVESGGEA